MRQGFFITFRIKNPQPLTVGETGEEGDILIFVVESFVSVAQPLCAVVLLLRGGFCIWRQRVMI